MFKPLFKKEVAKSPRIWDEHDLKHFIQGYLRDACKTEHIYCTGTGSSIVSLRVGSPALKQIMYLLEYDLKQELKNQAKYKLKKLQVQLI